LNDTFIFEWDCSKNNLNPDVYKFACLPDTISDYPHFVTSYTAGTGAKLPEQIPPDNFPAMSPYIGFQDPGLGGFLYVKISPLPDPCGLNMGDTFHTPNLCELDYILVNILDPIIGLLTGTSISF